MRTRFGSYEYTVMPFGLCNAPSTFQHFVNNIFSNLVGKYLVVYLNDILVYSRNLKDHIAHVQEVLQQLCKNDLFAKASKCKFHSSSLHFLGVVVLQQGLSMDPAKSKRILDWPPPSSVKSLQVFLGFSNFYRRFIARYAKKTVNLTNLLQKDTPFVFTKQAALEFEALKKAFTTAPILAHFNKLARTIVKTDASNYAIAGVISQFSSSTSLFHPVAFESCKLLAAELNYEIHDKELLAIFYCLKKWCSYLLSLRESFEVLTDHNSLKYFMSSKVLTRRQAQWAKYLSEFHFTITYRPGKQAVVPDALSRWDNVYPGGGSTFAKNNPENVRTLFSTQSAQLSLIIAHLQDLASKLRQAQQTTPSASNFARVQTY